MSAALRTGRAITGPRLSTNSNPIPIPSRGRRMSAKMMAASIGKARTGCRVTSAASPGVRNISISGYRARISWYAFMYLPA